MDYAVFYTVSVFLVMHFAVGQNIDCPQIYQRYSTDHSYCKAPNPSCNIQESTISDDEIYEILRLHNSFRSVIATQSTNGLPTAADMLQMEWDEELAVIAQRYAEQCIYAHDKADQRRVRNFSVGQNIAIQRITGNNVDPPEPDWTFAVSDWFEEVVYVSPDMICPFPQPETNEPEYRHFTQLVWARSFRLGCGYVMYKHQNTYTRLYVCNYGPGGNTYGSCVYRQGNSCTQCPKNTCCGSSCPSNDGIIYPGLCKRTNNQAPIAPIGVPTIFNCNFHDPSKEDCLINVYGDNQFYIIPALGGNYLEAVLNAGQNGTIVFSKQLKPNSSKFCVTLSYRKGPNLAKNNADNSAKELFIIPSMNHYTFTQPLPGYSASQRNQFSTYNLTLQWNYPTTMKVSFAVPSPNASPQYINVASIVAVNGACQNA